MLRAVEVLVVGLGDRRANQFASHVVGALHLAFVFEFEFAGDRGQRSVDVADARHHDFFIVTNRAALGVGDHVFHALKSAAAGSRRSACRFSCLRGRRRRSLDHLANIFRELQLVAVAGRPGFLRGDGDAFIHGGGIVGANLRADAVFERSDDLAARGVVLRIGAEDQRHIQRQAHRISLNLHVAFLHDVEQADLDFSGQVGQFVDGEDAAIGARQAGRSGPSTRCRVRVRHARL